MSSYFERSTAPLLSTDNFASDNHLLKRAYPVWLTSWFLLLLLDYICVGTEEISRKEFLVQPCFFVRIVRVEFSYFIWRTKLTTHKRTAKPCCVSTNLLSLSCAESMWEFAIPARFTEFKKRTSKKTLEIVHNKCIRDRFLFLTARLWFRNAIKIH